MADQKRGVSTVSSYPVMIFLFFACPAVPIAIGMRCKAADNRVQCLSHAFSAFFFIFPGMGQFNMILTDITILQFT